MDGDCSLVSMSHEVASSGVRVPSAFCPMILSRLYCIEGTASGASKGAPIGCDGIKGSMIRSVPPYFDADVTVGLAWVVEGADDVGAAVVGLACVEVGADVIADVVVVGGAVVVEEGCADEQLITTNETAKTRERENQTDFENSVTFFILVPPKYFYQICAGFLVEFG